MGEIASAFERLIQKPKLFAPDVVGTLVSILRALPQWLGLGCLASLLSGAGVFELAAPRPNPFSGTTEFELVLPEPSRVRCAIFDVAGRAVRVLRDGPIEAGAARIAWDGIDDRGRRVAPGVYFVRAEAGPHHLTRKVTLLDRGR